MTFNQILYFLAINEQKNFSRAAEKVFISQSSLSKQIKAIENELGVTLFSRGNYQVELTEAGKVFLSFAIKFSKDYSNMLENLSSFNNNQKSVLTIQIGTIPILCYSHLIKNMVNIELKNNLIHIDFVEREQNELLKMIDKGQIDFAIVRSDYLSPNFYHFTPLVTEEIGVFCSERYHLASKKILNLQDLKDEPFVLLNNTSSLYQLCIDACCKAGFTPKINYTSSRHEALLIMVNMHTCLTLLPKNLLNVEYNNNALKYIPLEDNITSSIALIRKKEAEFNDKNHTFQTFFKYFQEICLNSEAKCLPSRS